MSTSPVFAIRNVMSFKLKRLLSMLVPASVTSRSGTCAVISTTFDSLTLNLNPRAGVMETDDRQYRQMLRQA